MPKIDHITIQGFRSIRFIENLPLGPINVLVGPNGSGKSNVLESFAFLHAYREGRLREYVLAAGGADRVLHFGGKATPAIRFAFDFEPRHGSKAIPYSCEFARANDDSLYSERELIGCELSEAPLRIKDFDSLWKTFHFHDTSRTSPLRATSRLADNRHLRADGENLPAFLHRLAAGMNGESSVLERLARHPSYDPQGAYAQIRDAIRQVAPFFDDFVLEPAALNAETIRLEWKHVGTDRYFDASDLSDGTLRFIALATLFLQPAALRPSVILVDEPELGLHPAGITLLASLVRAASTTSQVILSTQSPTLLDHFEPHEVLVADRVAGETKIERLDAERLKGWLEDYSLGQLWEKNEIGGRPAPERPR